MIRAKLDGGTIVCYGDQEGALALGRIPGARHPPRTGLGTFTLPLNLDAFAALTSAGAQMDAALQEAGKRARDVQIWVDRLKEAKKVRPVKPVPIKPPCSLYQHQVKAFNLGVVLRNFAALMDMGTGKSLATVAITGRRYLDGKIRRVLVVAPSSVCPVWPREYGQFADFPHRVAVLQGTKEQRLRTLEWLTAPVPAGAPDPLRVAVVNYEACWRLKSDDGRRDYLMEYDADMIVCDESQRIKNPGAKQAKAMHALGDRARYRMILSGTPVQNNPLDVWSQWRFLDASVFGKSFPQFRGRYAVMGGVGNHQYLGARNLDELTRKAHSIALRVTKEECLDLPEKTFEDRYIELPEASMKLYKQLQRESYAELEGGEEITANNVLTRLLRLQQLTGGFLSGDDGKPTAVNHAKLDALEDIVQAICIDEGRKLVIFCRFRAEIEAINALVDKLLAPQRLTRVSIWGDVPISERGGLVNRFQTDPACRAFVGNIDACAEGITLNAACNAVYYSTNFNSAKYRQSQDRIHRIGQTHKCTYTHLLVPGTIDMHIMQALKSKEELSRTIVDNWKKYFVEE